MTPRRCTHICSPSTPRRCRSPSAQGRSTPHSRSRGFSELLQLLGSTRCLEGHAGGTKKTISSSSHIPVYKCLAHGQDFGITCTGLQKSNMVKRLIVQLGSNRLAPLCTLANAQRGGQGRPASNSPQRRMTGVWRRDVGRHGRNMVARSRGLGIRCPIPASNALPNAPGRTASPLKNGMLIPCAFASSPVGRCACCGFPANHPRSMAQALLGSRGRLASPERVQSRSVRAPLRSAPPSRGQPMLIRSYLVIEHAEASLSAFEGDPPRSIHRNAP